MSKTIGTVLTLKDSFSKTLKNTTKNTKGFQRQLKHTQNSIKGLRRSVVGLAGAYMGINAAKNFLSTSATAAKAQIDAETKLQAVLKNTKGITDENIASIKKYAGVLQNQGVIGDEVALSGVQQLGTYQLQADTLKALMPGMNDLLAQTKGLNATQDDAVSIGNLLGKTMTGQTSALRRVGINFDKAQEKVLKYGTEQEKAAMLATVLQQNVGGVNKALAGTDQGKTQQMTNAWGDFKEEVGKVVLLLQGKFAGWFITKIPMIQEKFLAIKESAKAFWKQLEESGRLDKLKAGFDKVTKAIGWVFGVASKVAGFIVDNWSAIEPLVIGLAVAIGIWTVAQGLLNIMMLANPLGLVVVGIGLLVAAGVALWQNWDAIKTKASELWTKVTEVFGGIGTAISGAFTGAWDAIKGFFDWIGDKLSWLGNKIKEIPVIGSLFSGGDGESKSGLNIGGKALGTSYWRGGLTHINERGGEIVDLPSGSKVIPADKSQKMMQGGGVTIGNITINAKGVTSSQVINEVIPQLKLAMANM